MKRNVFQRTKQHITDWFYGVDPDYITGASSDDDDCCESGDSGFSLYSMIGSEPDWAETVIEGTNNFKLGDHATVTLKTDEVIGAIFHLAVFLQVHNIRHGYHIAVRRYDDSSHDTHYSAAVLFNEEVKEIYEQWLTTYSTKVRDFERALPIIQEGDVINGTAIAFKGKTRRDSCPDDKLFNEWLWIVENCEGQVYASNKCWIFEDNTDAIKYKLTMF
jgi:hypothetical protein